MRKGTLFIAPPGARNKKAAIFEEIVSLCPEGDYSSVLYLGPNIFVLTEAKRQFFSYLKKNHKRSAYIPFQPFTIKHLAANLHEAYGKRDVISDRIRPLILCEIIKEKNIGYTRHLSDLLKKIKHYILDKDLSQIKEEIRQEIFEEKAANRAVKAIETLETYEDELNKKALIDSEGMLKNSISLIKEHINQSTLQTTGGQAEHPPNYRRASRAPSKQPAGKQTTDNALIVETLVVDGFFDPTPLEWEIIKTLIDKADKTYILVEEETEFFNCFQSHQAGLLTKRLERAIHRGNTGYYSYPSMEEEIEGIARGTKNLILEGVRPWEIIVSFPVLSKYLPMLRRVFQKYGIPLSIGEYALSNTKPFVALEEMITCIEDDYPRNDFVSFLTSAYFSAIPDILKEWAVTYSNRAGIIKGTQSWLSIKETLLNSPEEILLEADKERLDEFQREIKMIISVFENIKQKKDLYSFIDAVESALSKFGFFDSLSGSYEEISAKITNQLSGLRHFAGLYESNLHDIDTLTFYLRHLLRGLKGMDKNRDSVRVVPLELASGLEAKAIFFGGMVEGDFPSKPDIDPILPEKVKKTLDMPYLEYYLNRQKRYFRRLLNVPVNDPYFSCHSADGDKVFLPSPFLDWEKTISPLSLDIFTEEEVLIREGSIKQAGLVPRELHYDKEAYSALCQKTGIISRDFLNVTDIDFYRKCPLRFYIEKVLCLEIEMPPRFEVEARLWGRLAHKTMEYLFKDREIELDAMDKRLFKGLEISLKQFPIGDFWSKVAREIFRRLLPALKEQESDIRMLGFSPYMVEKNLNVEINGARLKGKVDRVDCKVQKSGDFGELSRAVRSQELGHYVGHPTVAEVRSQKSDDGQQSTVVLLDYKTGAIDRDSLQLPLYAAMWQKEAGENVEKVGYYSLKTGRVDWYPKKIKMEEFIEKALLETGELLQKIKKGIFTPAPFKDEECRYCYHSALCKGAK